MANLPLPEVIPNVLWSSGLLCQLGGTGNGCSDLWRSLPTFFPSNSTKLPYKSPQLGWDPSVGGLIPGRDAGSSAACVSIRVWLLLHVSL